MDLDYLCSRTYKTSALIWLYKHGLCEKQSTLSEKLGCDLFYRISLLDCREAWRQLSVKIYPKSRGLFLSYSPSLKWRRRNIAVLMSGCENFHCTIKPALPIKLWKKEEVYAMVSISDIAAIAEKKCTMTWNEYRNKALLALRQRYISNAWLFITYELN